MLMARVLDTQIYLDTVCALLHEGSTHVPVIVAGNSMTPFFDPGDTVYLDLPRGPVGVGDVILFARFGWQYVLHRVVRVFPDGSLELLGDAQVNSELVHPDQVRAIVSGLRRGDRLLDESSLRWRFFAHPWRVLAPQRPRIAKLLGLFRKR